MTHNAPTPEQRTQWRKEAGEAIVWEVGGPPVMERRILALLNALDAVEARHERWVIQARETDARIESTEARLVAAEAAIARVEALAERARADSPEEGVAYFLHVLDSALNGADA